MKCPICLNEFEYLKVSAHVSQISSFRCLISPDNLDTRAGISSKSTIPSVILDWFRCPLCKTDLSYLMDNDKFQSLKESIKLYYATGRWRVE